MYKVVNPIKKKTRGGRSYNVFMEINYTNDGKLSITGIEGPLASGNCLGGCGQIDMSLREEDRSKWSFNPGWNSEMMDKFLGVWDKWHLNDMRSTCEHQRSRGETYKNNPSAVCPDCGYKIGSAWLKEDVPQEVIQWLESLPEAKNSYAWV